MAPLGAGTSANTEIKNGTICRQFINNGRYSTSKCMYFYTSFPYQWYLLLLHPTEKLFYAQSAGRMSSSTPINNSKSSIVSEVMEETHLIPSKSPCLLIAQHRLVLIHLQTHRWQNSGFILLWARDLKDLLKVTHLHHMICCIEFDYASWFSIVADSY